MKTNEKEWKMTLREKRKVNEDTGEVRTREMMLLVSI